MGRKNPDITIRGRSEVIAESHKILEGLLSELPDQARALVAKVEQEVAKIQENAAEEIVEIREKAERMVQHVERKTGKKEP